MLPKQIQGYLSTVSPLLRSGASIAETVGCVLMPGTPRRTVVGGVFACAPWTQEFIRSVEQPRREERPFQQIGKTPPPREKPLLNPSANVVLETYTCTNSELCPHEQKKKEKPNKKPCMYSNLERGSLQLSRYSLRCALVSKSKYFFLTWYK